MNIQSLIQQELKTILSDAENSPIGASLKEFFDSEIVRVKAEVDAYIDDKLKSAFNPSGSTQTTTAASGTAQTAS